MCPGGVTMKILEMFSGYGTASIYKYLNTMGY
jgi:hypothetical protein